MCRSRRKLSNAYFLAKFRFDTAENEPCKAHHGGAGRPRARPPEVEDEGLELMQAGDGHLSQETHELDGSPERGVRTPVNNFE